jgi:hypothetical protein
LFKKFHHRINLATLFWTKSYLLNTVKPFSSHENRSLTKSQKPLQEGTLRNLNFNILSMQGFKLAKKTPEAKISALQNFRDLPWQKQQKKLLILNFSRCSKAAKIFGLIEIFIKIHTQISNFSSQISKYYLSSPCLMLFWNIGWSWRRISSNKKICGLFPDSVKFWRLVIDWSIRRLRFKHSWHETIETFQT